MRIINLTPHEIVICGTTYAPTFPPARVSTTEDEVALLWCDHDGEDQHVVPIIRSTFGEVSDLPLPANEIVYIVSRLVAAACPDRDDIYFPARLVRDDSGRITGADALGII